MLRDPADRTFGVECGQRKTLETSVSSTHSVKSGPLHEVGTEPYAGSMKSGDATFLAKLAEVSDESLQDLVDRISEGKGTRRADILIGSKSVDDEDIVPIAAPMGTPPSLIGSLSNSDWIPLQAISPGGQTLFGYLGGQSENPEMIYAILDRCIRDTIMRQLNELSRRTIHAAATSPDANSLMHKSLREIDEYINADEISLFIFDESRGDLILSSSTRDFESISKSNVYFDPNEASDFLSALNGENILHQQMCGLNLNDPFDNELGIKIAYSRSYWALKYYGNNMPKRFAPNSLGVLRITNPGAGAVPRDITRFDRELIELFLTIIFAFMQQYLRIQGMKFDMNRLGHGLGANIDAAYKYTMTLREGLFTDVDEFTIIPKFQQKKGADVTDGEVLNYLNDAMYFLDDASFQISKLGGSIDVTISRIDDFHATVLMPSVRMSQAIADVNSKHAPKFNNLVEAGSLKLPSIQGNREALISVLRNLIENSIKYTKDNYASIKIDFVVNESEIELHFRDQGIGVPDDRLEQIFVEGYRHPLARSISNRGIGVGLSYARSVMMDMGGGLDCIKSALGAHFRMVLRRSKT